MAKSDQPSVFLPRSIAEFYRKNQAASQIYVSDLPKRKEWLDEHLFLPEVVRCIDGRVLDFREAVGLPLGILEVYSAPGSAVDLGDQAYSDRTLNAIRKADCVRVFDREKFMVKMRMVTAHYSASRPTTASCAYRQHRIGWALEECEKHVAELNSANRGRMVAFTVIIETDLDALTIIGPNGRLDVSQLIKEPDLCDEVIGKLAMRRLSMIFPLAWPPLAAVPEENRNAFHAELAEMVMSNVRFVKQVIKDKRPVELLDHNEEMIFVGGHADWISQADHKSVFVLDSAIRERVLLEGFEIAVKNVAKKLISRAFEVNECDWMVPVVVNLPHDGELDRGMIEHRVRYLVSLLRSWIAANAQGIASYLRVSFDRPDIRLPPWLQKQIPEIGERFFLSPSISFRKDRLFRLIG